MTAPRGYRVPPGEDTPERREVIDEITRRGYRPFVAGDPLDETMQSESLRVVVQIGIDHLARLGDAEPGDWITADMVNRGLLAFLRDRDERERRWGAGQLP